MINCHYYALGIVLVLPLATMQAASPAATAVMLYKHAQVIQELKSLPAQAPAKIIESAKVQTQTTAYLSQPYLKTSAYTAFNIDYKPALAELVTKAIAREKEHAQDYYVFYHGQRFEFRVLQDVVKEILSLLKLKPKSKHFAFLRIPDEKTYSTLSPNQFLDNLQKTRAAWSDHEADLKNRLVSVNLSLFGNTVDRFMGECTFQFFLTSSNISSPSITKAIEDFFADNKFPKAFGQEFRNLVDTYKTNEGNLLQIFIPKKKADQCVYLARAFGTPYESVIVPAAYDYAKKRHTKIGPVLDKYINNPASIVDLDRLQGRLFISSSTFLDPDFGIKIFRYSTITKDQKKKYKTALKELVAKLLSHTLALKSEIALSSGDNPLKDTPFGKLITMVHKPTSAPDGSPAVLFGTGNDYYNKLDYARALKHYALVEKLDDTYFKAEAQTKLATMYYEGKGIAVNVEKARQYAERLAGQNLYTYARDKAKALLTKITKSVVKSTPLSAATKPLTSKPALVTKAKAVVTKAKGKKSKI